VASLLTSLGDGSLTWQAAVDSVFDSAEFVSLATSICNPDDPNYSFSPTPPGDLRQWAYGTASRTQEELQLALDDAQASCGTVELQREEVIVIGGDQPGTDSDNKALRIPSCVTLTTAGGPDPRRYAEMGRLVPGGLVCEAPSCSPSELVHVGDGARLANVWVDGRGANGRNSELALVATESGELPTEIVQNRLTDPPPGGTALRLEGYGTSATPCGAASSQRT
jgi:hypothetical protein